ncbi:MAG TPA: 2Fe-2S iron-sulfur cluster-binding protein [Solirubrobacteraceae bacterium]
MSDIKSDDEITTIEGLPATVGRELHPMQQAWLDFDVAQCGYCQPGQIMTAVALVEELRASESPITDAELDQIRNICRCGTYPRIREAIKAGAAMMPAAESKPHGHKHNAQAQSQAKTDPPPPRGPPPAVSAHVWAHNPGGEIFHLSAAAPPATLARFMGNREPTPA